MKPITEKRRCPLCRAVLSIYNPDEFCAPCCERELRTAWREVDRSGGGMLGLKPWLLEQQRAAEQQAERERASEPPLPADGVPDPDMESPLW